MPHLFVDITAHGLGHLSQVAPVLNALSKRCPDLRLTVRSAIPRERLDGRIHVPFIHIQKASDFGFLMHDATRVDLENSLIRYQVAHQDWGARVSEEAAFLAALSPDLVLTDVSYLPLAGAFAAGIPAWSLCSLNWADLFLHFFGKTAAAARLYHEMMAAYRSAEYFFRPEPAMAMPALENTVAIPPVAAIGNNVRAALSERLGGKDEKLILVAYGGFDIALPLKHWPAIEGVRYLVPAAWGLDRADQVAFEPLGFKFHDLLASVDAILTKPGYGSFVEAACSGVAVLYQRREDWPEQACLIHWLTKNARAHELSKEHLAFGDLSSIINALWAAPCPPVPVADGVHVLVERCIARLS